MDKKRTEKDYLIKEDTAGATTRSESFEDEYSPEKYIERGHISADDNAAFRKITDCIKCFGIYYEGYQRGTVPHPLFHNIEICFVKLINHGEWINTMTNDENIIYEENIDPVKNQNTIERWVDSERDIRYVFVSTKNHPKNRPYIFKGEYTLNKEATIREKRAVWERTAIEVPTIREKLKVGSGYIEKEE